MDSALGAAAPGDPELPFGGGAAFLVDFDFAGDAFESAREVARGRAAFFTLGAPLDVSVTTYFPLVATVRGPG